MSTSLNYTALTNGLNALVTSIPKEEGVVMQHVYVQLHPACHCLSQIRDN